jgi:ABC-2 type transport system permease protein
VNLSHVKIARLYEKTGLEPNLLKPEAFRNPVVSGPTVLLSPEGEKVGVEAELRSFIARLLVLAFAFVVTPASTYVIDGIIGERQRKTLELLLASPASLGEILTAKIIVATILGLLASIADITALLAYVGSLNLAFSGRSFILLAHTPLSNLILHNPRHDSNSYTFHNEDSRNKKCWKLSKPDNQRSNNLLLPRILHRFP